MEYLLRPQQLPEEAALLSTLRGAAPAGELRKGQPTMTDLRDRIAAALQNMTGDLTYEAMADAVIQELGLRQETTYAWSKGRTHVAGTRYVTAWRNSS